MSHQVRAVLSRRGRELLGWGASASGVLALMLVIWALMLMNKASIGWPTANEVELRCLETAPVGACADPRLHAQGQPATREVLEAFVGRLPARSPRLASTGRLEDRAEAHFVARQYEEHLQLVKLQEAPAAFLRVLSPVTLLTGLLALALGIAWRAARPQSVTVSVGRVVLGSRSVAIEQVASWSLERGLSLKLVDGSRLETGRGYALEPEAARELDAALRIAMERVENAAPLDTRALHAVRELAR